MVLTDSHSQAHAQEPGNETMYLAVCSLSLLSWPSRRPGFSPPQLPTDKQNTNLMAAQCLREVRSVTCSMKNPSLRLYVLLTRHILAQDWICGKEERKGEGRGGEGRGGEGRGGEGRGGEGRGGEGRGGRGGEGRGGEGRGGEGGEGRGEKRREGREGKEKR